MLVHVKAEEVAEGLIINPVDLLWVLADLASVEDKYRQELIDAVSAKVNEESAEHSAIPAFLRQLADGIESRIV